MALTDARANLKQWLDDLSMLRPFVDPNSPDAKPFVDAWAAALAKAKEAAATYTAEVK
jgi:hypothetical protein